MYDRRCPRFYLVLTAQTEARKRLRQGDGPRVNSVPGQEKKIQSQTHNGGVGTGKNREGMRQSPGVGTPALQFPVTDETPKGISRGKGG